MVLYEFLILGNGNICVVSVSFVNFRGKLVICVCDLFVFVVLMMYFGKVFVMFSMLKVK